MHQQLLRRFCCRIMCPSCYLALETWLSGAAAESWVSYELWVSVAAAESAMSHGQL